MITPATVLTIPDDLRPGYSCGRPHGRTPERLIRLLAAIAGTGATGTYNDAGELTSSDLSGYTSEYTYNADGERLTTAQGSTTESSATWNGAGRLTAYDNSAANMTAASYDGNGLRASSTITPAGKTAITQQYVWNLTASPQKLIMDSSNAYIYGTGGTPAEQVSLSTGAITYLVSDALGSVRGTVNSAGALTGTTSYDAWGNPESAGGLTAITPFGFAGGYTDPDGLIYLINRYYDPATGQFISVDPDLSQTQAPYAYASGDPVTDTDPNGESDSSEYGFGGKITGTAGKDTTVTWSIHKGYLISEISGKGFYIHYLSFWAFDVLPVWDIDDPRVLWQVRQPNGKKFNYKTQIFGGNYNEVGQSCVGDWFPYPCPFTHPSQIGAGTDGYKWTYVNRTFQHTADAQPKVEVTMTVEDPQDPSVRAACVHGYHSLSAS
jgi:RHS repeat-associated protein